MCINWNLIGGSSEKRTFVIPIGDRTPEEAKKMLAELISDYKEDIKIDNNGKIKIQMETEEKLKFINFARHCMIQLLTNNGNGGYPETHFPEITSYDLFRIEEILKKYE